MNERIMTAIKEIEAIRNAMGKEYAWENIEGDMIPQWQYYDSNDDESEAVPIERAFSDRKKMLDILQRFYKDYSCDFEGTDDFVTLFGVYCNQYIRFNLHQAIADNDFGIHELWPSINNIDFQEYLHLIQQGISKGIHDGYEDFLDANDLFTQKYSLPNLYLFIHSMQISNIIEEDDDKSNIEELIFKFYSNMNKDLRDYCMGSGNFIKPERDNEYPGNPNVLPYIVFCIPREHKVFHLAQKLTEALSDIKHSNNQNSLRSKLAQNNIHEAIQGIVDIINSNDPEDILEYAPTEWRDDDAIIYRLEFLSIPTVLNWNDGPNWLFNKVIIEILEKKQVLKEKDEIVKDFTHTYNNMKTTQLYKLVRALLSHENAEDRQLGRIALLEYTRKEKLTKNVYMMNLKYEHSTELLRNIIHESCSNQYNDTHNIQDIINQALLACLISAFYDINKGNTRLMQKNISQLWQDIRPKIIDFEKDVIYNNNNCINWLSRNGIVINIKTSPLWGELHFIPNGYAEVFLCDILTEFFVNFIKYSNIKKNAFLEFQGNTDSIQIKMINYLPEDRILTSNSRIGISAIGKMLHVLWGDRRDSNVERITTYYKQNVFTTSISLPTHVFYKEDSL